MSSAPTSTPPSRSQSAHRWVAARYAAQADDGECRYLRPVVVSLDQPRWRRDAQTRESGTNGRSATPSGADTPAAQNHLVKNASRGPGIHASIHRSYASAG